MNDNESLTGVTLHQLLLEYDIKIYNKAWNECLDLIQSRIAIYYLADKAADIDYEEIIKYHSDYVNIIKLIRTMRKKVDNEF